MKPARSVSALLSLASAFLIQASLAQAQGRGGNAPEPPTLKGKVVAYEADLSVTLEAKIGRGAATQTVFVLVKGKTQIELGAGIKAVEPGMMASVWADKNDPKTAARILVEPEAPAAKGKVVAYEADKSITVETKTRNGSSNLEFSLIKDKTQIELSGGAKAIEVGMTVSIWADKDNSKNAAKIVVQGAAQGGRGRGGAGAAPPKAEDSKPAGSEPAPKAEEAADVNQVLEAYKANLPAEKNLEWYTLDWVNTLREAKERAAKENRPVLFIQTNKEGDLFCSLC